LSSLGKLRKLRFLDVSSNRFSGSILEEDYSEDHNNLRRTQQNNRNALQMHANDISTITLFQQQSFFNLPSLKYLYLSNNTFTGTISNHITELSELTQLWLNDNQFSGNFPDVSNTSWPYLGKFKFT